MTVIHRQRDPEALANAAATYILELAEAQLEESEGFSIALAGGTTPKRTYELLGDTLETELDPIDIYVFWSDERCVPPNDPMNNYRMAHTTFLSRVPIPDDQIHPIRCEEEAKEGAAEYEGILRTHFAPADEPQFDLVLLGLGEDGHTASLFPGSELLEEQERWVAAEFVQSLGGWRVTLTPVAINAAAHVAFIVEGKRKAEAVHRVIVGAEDPASWPAQLVAPEGGQLHWFLDEAAAMML